MTLEGIFCDNEQIVQVLDGRGSEPRIREVSRGLCTMSGPLLSAETSWPSGLRRNVKAVVFGRGFESHRRHFFFDELGAIREWKPCKEESNLVRCGL